MVKHVLVILRPLILTTRRSLLNGYILRFRGVSVVIDARWIARLTPPLIAMAIIPRGRAQLQVRVAHAAASLRELVPFGLCMSGTRRRSSTWSMSA